MGEVRHRRPALPPLPLLGRIMDGPHSAAVHLRRIHLEEDKLAMVERRRRPHTIHHVVGRCTRLRARRRLFHQPLFLPELRHTVKLVREITPHGRLPLRVESELRTAHSADTTHHATHTAHSAHLRMQVVHRMAAMGLQTRERAGKD